jgi:hypothetical protein
MTWTKLSDDFSDDCWTLSDKAVRLHLEGLVWSNRKLLDLVIPKEDIRRFAKRPEALEELFSSGWWKDNGDDVEILHHGTYQRLRDKVIAQQIANTTNQARRGRVVPPAREIADKPKGVRFVESPDGNASLNDSLNDSFDQSHVKRDRTGRLIGKDDVEAELATDWPVAVIPGKNSDIVFVNAEQVGGEDGMTHECFVCGSMLGASMASEDALCNSEDTLHDEAFKRIQERKGFRLTA